MEAYEMGTIFFPPHTEHKIKLGRQVYVAPESQTKALIEIWQSQIEIKIYIYKKKETLYIRRRNYKTMGR